MIKKHDFIELNYTGKLKENNNVFDTTVEAVAKENHIHNPKLNYQPAVICVGEHQILKGIDDYILNKEPGKYTIEIKPEDGFGKKNAKLVQLIPTSKFKKENIQPQIGMQINVDGYPGIVKSVTGGRTIVDFNHPLSGKELVYEIEIIKIIQDNKIKLTSFLNNLLGLPKDQIQINENNIKLPQKLPDAVTNELKKKIKEILAIDVEFQ